MRNKKPIVLVLLLMVLGFPNASGQDIYDYQHSKRFASHLLRAGQYEQSIVELERLVFFNTQSDTLRLQLLTAYRKAEKFSLGTKRAAELYPALYTMPAPAAYEYGKFFIDQKKYAEADAFWLQSTTIPVADQQVLSATASALDGNFSAALRRLDAPQVQGHPLAPPYRELFGEAAAVRLKSPALAGIMSGLVPSSGRFYARDWKDGLFSLVFMSTSAWQSYRGFQKKGAESVRGWAFGGIALGFYLGNIYGSAKAATRYNQLRRKEYLLSTERLFQSHYRSIE